MVDETITENAGNEVTTETSGPPATIKKTRAARRSKAEIEAAAAAKSAAKGARTKGRRTKLVSKAITDKSEKSVGAPGPISQISPVDEPRRSSVETLDDIATLIELEEENRRLRKQLSDKLYAENAELRKRLGHN